MSQVQEPVADAVACINAEMFAELAEEMWSMLGSRLREFEGNADAKIRAGNRSRDALASTLSTMEGLLADLEAEVRANETTWFDPAEAREVAAEMLRRHADQIEV